MQLVNIEGSRVVSLAGIRAPTGQPFVLDVLGSLVNRYAFQHYPDKAPGAGVEAVTLSVGKWNNIQIDEIIAYGDGVVVNARAPTNEIEAFLEDVYSFIANEFGVIRIEKPGERKLFESAIVVEMDQRIETKFAFLEGLYEDLSDLYGQYGYGDASYRFSGIQAETESPVAGKRRAPFSLARRIEVPHSTNYWYSAAALRTDDHLAVLERLERQLLK